MKTIRFKNTQQRWLLGCLMMFPFYTLQAQTFEEYMQAQNQAFNAWKSEQDRAFYQFLKEGWKAYDIDPGVEVKRPKPETLPVAEPKPVLTEQPELEVETPPVEPIVEIQPIVKPVPAQPAPTIQPVPTTPPMPAKPSGMPMDFYGKTLYWPENNSWKSVESFRVGAIGKDRVAEFWKTFAQVDSEPVIESFHQYASELNLNGWGRLQLAYALSDKLTDTDVERKLLTWALMVKMDEAVRLGYDEIDIYLLYHSLQPLYNVNFWRYDGQPHYIFEPDGAPIKVKNLYSYKGNFSQNPQPLNLDYRQNPDLFIETKMQTIAFDHKGQSYQFQVPVSQGYADYLYTLPLQANTMYFGRKPSKEMRQVLIPQVKAVVKDMSTSEAVNFLLAFVQKGLKYKLDKDQFNRSEKYLLPEETLLHIYSDCEDHSFLFTWLVQETLDIPIVGLDYPGHIATAVSLDKPKGKSYFYQQRRYVVADPTYINAPYGLEMPQFKNSKVKIVPVQ